MLLCKKNSEQSVLKMVPLVDVRSHQEVLVLKLISQCSQAAVSASGDAPPPPPLPLCPAATVFLTSSRLNGVASKGHVFSSQPALAPSCKTSQKRTFAGRSRSELTARCSACGLLSVSCQKQAVSQVLELRNRCCWLRLALYARGSPSVERLDQHRH